MGVKYIHVVLIVASIVLALFFGVWTLNCHETVFAYSSFIIAVGLTIYCINFLRKIRTL